MSLKKNNSKNHFKILKNTFRVLGVDSKTVNLSTSRWVGRHRHCIVHSSKTVDLTWKRSHWLQPFCIPQVQVLFFFFFLVLKYLCIFDQKRRRWSTSASQWIVLKLSGTLACFGWETSFSFKRLGVSNFLRFFFMFCWLILIP